jgi:hypothetical protein
MTTETAARLKEITVDVKTVELSKKVEASAVGLPKPEAELKPGTINYKAGIAVAGQNIPMTVTTEVKEEGGRWLVNSTAKAAAFGEMVDKTTYEKGSLVPVSRWISQGPVVVDLQFKEGKAAGTMTVNGQAKPVAVDLGGQLFADGSGAPQALAALPLAEGYTTTFRNFDVQGQKVKLRQLKVAAAEQVTVPAGTFEAFKLEVTSAEGEADKITLWVDKATRQVVKIVSVVPAMSGAVITAELTP